jgi:hypothetical protein
MKNIFNLIFIYFISNYSIAGYTVNIPLELNGGTLPVDTIVFINPSLPNPPDPEPTEPVTSGCYYSLTEPAVSGFAESYINGYYYKEMAYEGKEVINGIKGELKATFTGNGNSTTYSEICFGPEGPIFKVSHEEDLGWDIDDCRYNSDPNPVTRTDNLYYWREISGQGIYSDKRAFTNAFLGNLGSITYQSSGLTFPNGYINTSYGQIQPQDNVTIKRGSIYFSRGNFQQSNGTEFFYAICKRTVN